jgi:thymidylate synthase ThyX
MTDKSQKVFVYHDLHPEDGAMLQALYSRSPDTVVNHLEKVKEAGSGNFMSKFYVGYGHSSIGDCGTTTLFIENVSMLVAKAIQDNPLYSGQEASTRYLDFSEQPLIDPYHSPATAAILQEWMDMYNTFMPVMQDSLKARNPFDPAVHKKAGIWENALKAQGFDIMRSLLPVGTTTLLSWHTNIRQARDKLMKLKSHPLPEIRDVAHKIFQSLIEKYPNSFTGEEMAENAPRYTDRDSYNQTIAETEHYLRPETVKNQLSDPEWTALKTEQVVIRNNLVDVKGLNAFEKPTLTARPQGGVPPRSLSTYGKYNLYFLLDFGSFRDIQRHRNGVCRLPVVTGAFGLHPWYVQQLKEGLGDQWTAFKSRFDAQMAKIAALPAENDLLNQYYYPMGMQVACHLAYDVPEMMYVAELRSAKTVHPTLRPVAQAMGRQLERDFPAIKLYVDYDESAITAKRGEQTIMKKAG